MRKSRLNLFKSTSMLISVVGIIMIISTIVVVAYVGFSMVSSGITNEISSGNQYDELAELKSSYSDLESQFDSVKSLYYNNGDTSQVQKYNDARLELTKADSAIQNVQSALDSGKSSNEVDSRIDFAKEKSIRLLQSHTIIFNLYFFIFLGLKSNPTTYISELFLREDGGFVVFTCLYFFLSLVSMSLYSGP